MFQSFLKKQDFTKLQLFHYIAAHDNVDINELIAIFDISRTSIKRYITDLNTQLQIEDSTLDFQISQTDSFHYSIKPLTQEKMVYLYYKLALSYFKFSPTFQLFELFFAATTLQLYDICDKLILSENYCYKIINQLNSILKKFSLSIEKDSDNQSFSIVGEENNIRFVYFVLLVNTYQSLEWPFENISQATLKKSHPKAATDLLAQKSLSTQTRVEFFLAVIDKRLRDGHFITPANLNIYPVIQLFMEQHDITKHIPHFPASFPLISGSEKEANEREYFNFFTRIFDSDIDSAKEKLVIGEALSKLNHPLTNFYSAFLPSFQKKYHLPTKKTVFFELMYHTVLYHVYSLYSSLDASFIQHINQHNQSSLIQTITDYTATFTAELDQALSQKLPDPQFKSSFTLNLVSITLVLLFQIHKEKKLAIFVQYSREPLGNSLIKSEIHHFFSNDSIQFVSDIQEADILISDCIEAPTDSYEFYFFEDITRNTSWINLFSFLQKKLHQMFYIDR